MYRILFNLAGLAIFGWVLLVFFPTWRVTRRIADSALFPAYIALLYVVGVFAVFREMGPGIMADFGTADGVLGLLQNEGLALVAWIHILAFDQVVAHLIYRDNMKHRFVPVVVQSVILVVTLMLGPLEDTLNALPSSVEENRQRVETAHRNALRLLKLVNTLLDFSRIEADRVQASYEPVDLAKLTEELASVFRSAVERASASASNKPRRVAAITAGRGNADWVIAHRA